jgi:hypothetical protein
MEHCINTSAFGSRWSHTDCFTSIPLAEAGSRKNFGLSTIIKIKVFRIVPFPKTLLSFFYLITVLLIFV